MIEKSNKNDVSRRKFLKGGAILGAAVGLSSLNGGETTEKIVKALGKVEQQDGFPHEFNSDFERYDESRTTFSRIMADPKMKELTEGLPGLYQVVDNTKPGITQLDNALHDGAGAVDKTFGSQMFTWDGKPTEQIYQFTSKEAATKAVKKAAKFYGTSLVGITPYDNKWVYKAFKKGGLMGKECTEDDFPFKPKSVIVLAIEMDYEGMSTAPSALEMAATAHIYSRMAEIGYKLATFIQKLGFNAFACGNDTAMSVPYAIAAGLGEQGRQGLLITYEYGPRVRLCKVFTEMELNYDKPVKFGANDFCRVCKKCAYTCPSQSISLEDEMTFKAEKYSISNQEGVKKYYVDVETCFQYWNTCGNDCGCCIASCPFNKPDFWHHRITTAMTSTPLKPFLNEMDDLFGYGNVFDENAILKFWDGE